jgi:hypothetical protein
LAAAVDILAADEVTGDYRRPSAVVDNQIVLPIVATFS